MSIVSRTRQTFRSLARQPGFTIPAVLTLALSIGATTAVFSVLYGILLSQLPYRDPGRLVLVWENDLHNHSPREGASLPDLRDWQRQSKSFWALAGSMEQDMTLSDPPSPAERLRAAHVTFDLFSTLGVKPALGRVLTDRDDLPNSARVAMIDYDMWQTRFGGNPAVLGKILRLENADYSIVGVMPRAFSFPADTQVWTALEPVLDDFQHLRGVHGIVVLGRLRDGATVQSAQNEMSVIANRLAKAYPADNVGRGVFIEPLHEAIAGRTRPVLLLLFGAALLVLLIGCANVAGLMVVRVGQRAKEIAVRFALGASRRTVAQQVLLESLLISFAGSVAGIALAMWGVQALLLLAPQTLPRRDAIAVNLPVMIFAVAIAVLACVLSGMLPAISASGQKLQKAVRDAGANTDPRQSRHSRRLLIVGELALAVVLTIGALLLLRSYARLGRVGVGVSHLDLITAELRFPEGKYPTPSRKEYPNWPKMTVAYAQILDACRRIPGVTEVALALNHPLRAGWTSQATVVGRPAAPGPPDELRIRPVSPGYARTVGLPLLKGREFDESDRNGAEPVAMINEATVRKYFPAEDPIGKKIEFWGTARRIVGVVGNERFLGLQRGTEPAIYPPLDQIPMSDIFVVIRSERTLSQILPELRSALAQVDPDIPLTDPLTLDTLVSRSLAPERFTTVLLSIFGAMALLLAAVGVFGLIAYQVSLRLRELGIRTALGAKRRDLVLLIVREAGVLSGIAVVVGWCGAISLTRFLTAFLFEITPLDASAFFMSGLVLVAIGLAAGAIPAIRASRVDPMSVLRAE
ncbi:MAG TPA: ABC transporter permease [Thermoanaerobaculia bacterium]|nr:ABC transporter permease [Thermoanaerobaculia bacterium]